MRTPTPGLCGTCLHMKRIESRTGSVFYMCQRAADDSRFRQYPPIPVLRCVGFELAAAAGPAKGSSVDESDE